MECKTWEHLLPGFKIVYNYEGKGGGSHRGMLAELRKKMAWFMTPPMAPPALTSPQTMPRDLRDTKGTTPYTAPQVACNQVSTQNEAHQNCNMLQICWVRVVYLLGGLGMFRWPAFHAHRLSYEVARPNFRKYATARCSGCELKIQEYGMRQSSAMPMQASH